MGFAEKEMNVTSKNNSKIIGFVCKCTKTWKECKYVPFLKKVQLLRSTNKHELQFCLGDGKNLNSHSALTGA